MVQWRVLPQKAEQKACWNNWIDFFVVVFKRLMRTEEKKILRERKSGFKNGRNGKI